MVYIRDVLTHEARHRVSEFFSGKRALSKGRIELLREKLGLSADVLMG